MRNIKNEYHFEVLDLWKRAIAYFNSICGAVENFSAKSNFKLEETAKKAALSVSDSIARGSKSFSKRELNDSLENAVESLASIISTLNIASEQNYIRKDVFQEVYHEGKLLARRIENFKLRSGINLN